MKHTVDYGKISVIIWQSNEVKRTHISRHRINVWYRRGAWIFCRTLACVYIYIYCRLLRCRPSLYDLRPRICVEIYLIHTILVVRNLTGVRKWRHYATSSINSRLPSSVPGHFWNGSTLFGNLSLGHGTYWPDFAVTIFALPPITTSKRRILLRGRGGALTARTIEATFLQIGSNF